MQQIKIDDLDKVITKELKVYNESITKGIKRVNDECMEEFVTNTKRDAPRGLRKKYFRYITSKTTKETPNNKVNVWFVKDPEYRLTHLLKRPHKTGKGSTASHTKGNKFLDNNYEILEKKFEKKIKEVIKNGY